MAVSNWILFFVRDVVYFPKTLRLENARLTMLHWFTIIVFLIIFWAVYSQRPEWNLREDVSSSMHFEYWQEATNYLPRDAQSDPVCTDMHRWDYWYSHNWKYANFTCLQLCNVSTTQNTRDAFLGSSHGCAHEAYSLQRIDPRTVMIHSMMMESVAGPSTPYGEGANYLIPNVYQTKLAFSYWFTFRTYSHILFQWDEHKGTSTEDIRTIVVQGGWGSTVVREIWPPGDRSVSVRALLDLAGRPDEFDEVQPLAGRNVMENAHIAEGPIGWISGLELVMQIYCTNFQVEGFEDLEPFDGHTCYMYLQLTENMWITRETTRALDAHGTTMIRKYGGLRIKVRLICFWDVYDIGQLIGVLRDLFIWMGLSTTLMSFFLSYCLGHMSKIFRQAFNREFDLRTEIAGSAARLVSCSVPFVELVDSTTTIPKTRLQQRLGHVLHRHAAYLDSAEVEVLYDFCFKAIIDDMKSMDSSVGRFGGSSDEKKEIIRCDEFLSAVANNEEVELVHVPQLFDVSRKITWMEWLFMPMYMKQWFKDVKALRKFQKEINSEHNLDSPRRVRATGVVTQSTQFNNDSLNMVMRKHPSVTGEVFQMANRVLLEKSPAWLLWNLKGPNKLRTLEDKRSVLLFLIREVAELALLMREQQRVMEKLIEHCEGFEESFMSFNRRVFALTIMSFMGESKIVRDRIVLKGTRLDSLQSELLALEAEKNKGDDEGASIASRIFPLRSLTGTPTQASLPAGTPRGGRYTATSHRATASSPQRPQQQQVQPFPFRAPSHWGASQSSFSSRPPGRRNAEDVVAFEGEWFSALPPSSNGES